ncbi:hypothetical protein AB0I53_46975, partial [Saccharopolyspora sp. NPDC050389]|uniref:hypothetical protein n=1 Tax=Saccharopolyspora sp. NPDC050389 TaxID=3155516 RepID=UPI0033DFDBEB
MGLRRIINELQPEVELVAGMGHPVALVVQLIHPIGGAPLQVVDQALPLLQLHVGLVRLVPLHVGPLPSGIGVGLRTGKHGGVARRRIQSLCESSDGNRGIIGGVLCCLGKPQLTLGALPERRQEHVGLQARLERELLHPTTRRHLEAPPVVADEALSSHQSVRTAGHPDVPALDGHRAIRNRIPQVFPRAGLQRVRQRVEPRRLPHLGVLPGAVFRPGFLPTEPEGAVVGGLSEACCWLGFPAPLGGFPGGGLRPVVRRSRRTDLLIRVRVSPHRCVGDRLAGSPPACTGHRRRLGRGRRYERRCGFRGIVVSGLPRLLQQVARESPQQHLRGIPGDCPQIRHHRQRFRTTAHKMSGNRHKSVVPPAPAQCRKENPFPVATRSIDEALIGRTHPCPRVIEVPCLLRLHIPRLAPPAPLFGLLKPTRSNRQPLERPHHRRLAPGREHPTITPRPRFHTGLIMLLRALPRTSPGHRVRFTGTAHAEHGIAEFEGNLPHPARTVGLDLGEGGRIGPVGPIGAGRDDRSRIGLGVGEQGPLVGVTQTVPVVGIVRARRGFLLKVLRRGFLVNDLRRGLLLFLLEVLRCGLLTAGRRQILPTPATKPVPRVPRTRIRPHIQQFGHQQRDPGRPAIPPGLTKHQLIQTQQRFRPVPARQRQLINPALQDRVQPHERRDPGIGQPQILL